MTIIATLKDGRLIARTAITATPVSPTTDTGLTVTVPDLKKVEYVLQWNFDLTPSTQIHHFGTSVGATNVVGVTVYCAAGTTVSGEVLTIGF